MHSEYYIIVIENVQHLIVKIWQSVGSQTVTSNTRGYGIQSLSDARNGYRYRIVNREWLEKDNVKDWLLSAFAVNGLLQDSKGLRDRVMYETIPYGNGHLLKILECMKKKPGSKPPLSGFL